MVILVIGCGEPAVGFGIDPIVDIWPIDADEDDWPRRSTVTLAVALSGISAIVNSAAVVLLATLLLRSSASALAARANAAQTPPRNAPAFTKLRRSNKPEIFIVRTPCLIPSRIRSFVEKPSGVRCEHARFLVAN
jgi:hypothetical protein